MGGTSCDVCVVEGGGVRRTDSRRIGGRVIQLPMVDVHTVGAGGGSIGWRDTGGALRVGPAVGRCRPGPACYGRGGTEPTVTDANLLLGYLDADSTLAGGVDSISMQRAERCDSWARPSASTTLETAEGIVRVANQEMARALRVVTVERGIDPRDFALMPFGGAGPMHAAALADELGMDRILCPRASGVLSALGLIASDRRRDTARTVLLSGSTTSPPSESRPRSRRFANRSGRGSRSDRGGRPTSSATAGQAFELAFAGSSDARSRRPGGAIRAPSTSAATATASPTPEVELVNVRLALSRRGAGAVARGRAGPAGSSARTRRARFGGDVAGRPRSCAASPRPAPRRRAHASSSCPRRRWSFPPDGGPSATSAGTIVGGCATR